MARRHIVVCGIPDFALYDCKVKGATDMFQGGMSLEEAGALRGHDRVTTTKKYIKRHLIKTIVPNDRQPERTGRKGSLRPRRVLEN